MRILELNQANEGIKYRISNYESSERNRFRGVRAGREMFFFFFSKKAQAKAILVCIKKVHRVCTRPST